MDTQKLKAEIIERLKHEGDGSKLDAILRLLEVSETQWKTDNDLIGNVLIAEREYADGKALSLETARELAKRSARS